LTFHFLTVGITLGLSAGFAPGPLLTLVISETLRHDYRAGMRVAAAPIITDLPIILLTLLVFSQLAAFDLILGWVSLLGGVVVFTMGVQSLKITGSEVELQSGASRSLFKGVIANFLNPQPYLFWATVGAPIIFGARSESLFSPLVFIGSFYFCLVGSKIVLSLLVGRSRSFMSGNIYVGVMRVLGVVLCLLALSLFARGLEMMGVEISLLR
jgi:threonine/homoserine/homoserine lactone efflux protein